MSTPPYEFLQENLSVESDDSYGTACILYIYFYLFKNLEIPKTMEKTYRFMEKIWRFYAMFGGVGGKMILCVGDGATSCLTAWMSVKNTITTAPM